MSRRSTYDQNNLDDGWNPMQDAFHDPHFNTYKDGPGANLELEKQPCFTGASQRRIGPCKLYVGNIPLDVDKEGIENTFRTVGNPRSVFRAIPPANSSRTWAFVTFDSLREAEDVMRKLNRKPPMNLNIQIAKGSEPDDHVKRRPVEDNESSPNSDTQSMNVTKKTPLQRNSRPSKGRGLVVASYVDPRTPGPGNALQEKVDIRLFQQYGGSNYDESNTALLHGVQRANGPGGPRKFVMGRGSFDREMDMACQPNRLGKVVKNETEAKNSIENYLEKKNGVYEFSKKEHPPTLAQNSCTLCKQPSTMFCAQCKDWYCSKSCQLKDWPRHRNYCGEYVGKNRSNENESSEVIELPKEDKGKGQGVNSNQQRNRRMNDSYDRTSTKDASGMKSSEYPHTKNRSPLKNHSSELSGKEPMCNGGSSHNGTTRNDSNNSFEKESNPSKDNHTSPRQPRTPPRKSFKNDKMSKGANNKRDEPKKPKEGCELIQQLPDVFTNVTVQVVLGSGEYWVQLSSNIKETFALSNKMEMVSSDLAPVKLSVGAFCMAKFDNVWFRAKITSIEPEVKIFFIDFGNEEVASPGELRVLPDCVKQMSAQAIRIKLAPETSQKYLKLDVGVEFSVKNIQRNVKNGIITVHVEGETYLQTLPKEVEQACDNSGIIDEEEQIPIALQSVTVLLKSNMTCFMGVTEYNSDKEFLACFMPSDMKNIYNSLFTEAFQKECDGLKCDGFSPKIGELVLAKSAEEGWIRAYVLYNCPKTQYTVASCDLGVVVDAIEVKRIPKKCREIAQFAVQCSTVSETKSMQQFTGNVTIIECTSDSAIAVVDSGGEVDCKIEITKWVPPYELYEELKCVELKNGDCVISAEMSPFEIYIRPMTNSCIEIYNRLLQDVAKHCFLSPPLNYLPKVGQVLASKYSEDGSYYRAVVREIHPSKGVKVQYIDFGNVEYVPQDSLKPLTKKLRDVECSVVKVILKDVVDRPLNEEVQRLFKDLILETARLKLKLVEPQSNRVELYTRDGTYLNDKINEMLVPGWKKGVVDKHVYTSQDVRGENLEPGSLVKLAVMSVVRDSVIVRLENSKALHVLENDLQEAIDEYCSQTSEPYTPREKELCLAKIDNTWCRCVCVNGGNPLTLYLIDNGQVREAAHEDIRKYLQEFTMLPAVGIRCTLTTKVKGSIHGLHDHIRKYLTTMRVITAEVLGRKTCGDDFPGFIIAVPELDKYLQTL